MGKRYILEKYLAMAKEIHEERKKTYCDAYKEMSIESLIDFAKCKLERYKYTKNKDDLADILNYIEFIMQRTGA